MCSYGCSATVYLWIFRWSTGEAASGGSSWQWGSLVKRWPRTQCTTFCSTQEVKEATFTRIMTNAFRSKGHKCGGRSCCWTFQQDLQGWSCFCGYHFETKYVLNTGFVGGEPEGKLRGGANCYNGCQHRHQERIGVEALPHLCRQVRVTAVWNKKKPSSHSDESLVRRPRLGKNSADFSEQVTEAASKCKVRFFIVVFCGFCCCC